jgi:hypothetical protein
MAIAETHRRTMAPEEYAAMVERTRDVVREHVPPGTTVAVISRGDEALVTLDARRGWHFPRTATGLWAGHHPADSKAAVAHLEETRLGGAAHLVVPASARWWLDHYEGFAEHLRTRGVLVAEDPACTLYALGDVPVERDEGEAADAITRERLARFLDALLPERCRVLLTSARFDALTLPERAVVPLHAALPDPAEEALRLLVLGRQGDESTFLVIPLAGPADAWRDELLSALDRQRPALARRDGLAAVFDLNPSTNGRVPA